MWSCGSLVFGGCSSTWWPATSYHGFRTTTGTATLGPAARPVAVPDDLGSLAVTKATGRIELPLGIRWSGRPKVYDLDERSDRIRVYEQVLREGTEDHVRYYVKADELLELWDELVLPPRVRQAWAEWIGRHRSPNPAC